MPQSNAHVSCHRPESVACVWVALAVVCPVGLNRRVEACTPHCSVTKHSAALEPQPHSPCSPPGRPGLPPVSGFALCRWSPMGCSLPRWAARTRDPHGHPGF